MSDYRNEFLQQIERNLVTVLDPDQLVRAVGIVTMILGDYEIVERCTDIAVLDDTNDRLIRRYCACLMVDGKSDKTISQYRRTVMKLSESLRKPFTEIGTYEIRYYLACEKNRGLSNASLENVRSCISAFFSWMQSEEIIENDPTQKINPIKVPTEVKKPFSDVEIDALRSGCRSLKERAVVEILLSTGVRVNELCEMKIEDIDMGTMAVHVTHGKGGKERITYISAVGRKHLAQYLSSRKDKMPYVILNKNYTKISTDGVRTILNTIAERAKVENVHPHRFRRTFATGLASRGMDIQVIQKLLGHSRLDTTLRYVSTSEDQVKEAYKRYIS